MITSYGKLLCSFCKEMSMHSVVHVLQILFKSMTIYVMLV